MFKLHIVLFCQIERYGWLMLTKFKISFSINDMFCTLYVFAQKTSRLFLQTSIFCLVTKLKILY